MREKKDEGGPCPYCGFRNESYRQPVNQLRPLTLLNGKYLLGRSLGAGGLGITYLALDLYLQIVVAVKELYLKKISIREGTRTKTVSVNSSDSACFEENKKRFLREARVLAMFNENDNEGVVTIKEFFEENNTAYIVMEYLDGKILKNAVRSKKMSFEQVKTLFKPICHALVKIHQFGVAHLDVSPDNIMVLDNNRAKLLDFGGVKTEGSKDIIPFKRGYAPPEQYMENGNIGQWTDVYAAAATMYYCLTGKRPVDSMERKAGTELKRPSKRGAKIPPDVENALLKALELNPDDRFQTMEAFWDSLDIRESRSKKGIVAGGIIAAAAAAVVLLVVFNARSLMLLSGGHNETEASGPDTMKEELTAAGTAEPEEELKTQGETRAALVLGETIPMVPGTYIFENARDRHYIMGIDAGSGDDGTAAVLKDYEESNINRFFVTDEDRTDDFYHIRAAHTTSFIETSGSQEIGETVRQFSEMNHAGTEKWIFVYCGHDDEKDMDEVIIQNAAGSVLAPENGILAPGTEIVLSEYNMEDDAQKWYLRWSEKDPSEEDVIVYHEGDLVENISGTFHVASALDGKTSVSINRDKTYHAEPTAVVFYAEWLTSEDLAFEFEFIPTGNESRYRIFPLDQVKGEHKCLEFNPDTSELVMREESDNENQLFRVIYVKSNTYLIQTFNESVLGFDLHEDGSAEGAPVVARPYESFEDSRVETWLLQIPDSPE